MYAIDIDGDGDIDALSALAGLDTVAWYENNGDGTSWEYHEIFTMADACRSVWAIDIDGDGDPDVITGSIKDDTIRW